MSTSRKLRVKLAKHRHSARKAARKEPEPEAAESSTAETQASTERGTVTARSALTGTQFVCFCHWLLGQKLFAGLSLFTCTFQSLPQADDLAVHEYLREKTDKDPGSGPGGDACISHQ